MFFGEKYLLESVPGVFRAAGHNCHGMKQIWCPQKGFDSLTTIIENFVTEL